MLKERFERTFALIINGEKNRWKISEDVYILLIRVASEVDKYVSLPIAVCQKFARKLIDMMKKNSI